MKSLKSIEICRSPPTFAFELQSTTSRPVMHFNKIVTLLLICCVAASFQKPRGRGKNTMNKESVSVEKAIEDEDMALIKEEESVLPAPEKKIAEAEVALVQKIEKDIVGEEKKVMGNADTVNADLVSMFKALLQALETGKLSLGPAIKALQDIMAIDTAVSKDVMAEAGKLQGPARKVVDAGMGAAKASQGLLKKEAGQAMKIGSEVLKADEALAAGIAQEEGQLLTGNFDTAAIEETEEKFAKSLVGAEQEAAKDAQMDAAIKA